MAERSGRVPKSKFDKFAEYKLAREGGTRVFEASSPSRRVYQ